MQTLRREQATSEAEGHHSSLDKVWLQVHGWRDWGLQKRSCVRELGGFLVEGTTPFRDNKMRGQKSQVTQLQGAQQDSLNTLLPQEASKPP